jgi:prephenate dehydrogenase
MPKPLFESVAIVGVGLIGGSVGLALRERGIAKRVVGVGRRRSSLDVALARRAVDEATTDLAEGVEAADLVVIGTPVGSVVDAAKAVAALQPDTLTTDVGSTKAEIVAALAELRFVGSHPMAGDHRSGCESARADLFAGRLVLITPSEESAPEDVSRITALWTALGASVRAIEPDRHDEIVAAVSHVPHLAAAALAVTTPEEFLPFVGQGWQDATRIAAGDPALWLEIAAANRSNIVQQLSALEHAVGELRRALEEEKYEALEEILQEAKQKRDAVGS